jgi:rare lipoprotein A
MIKKSLLLSSFVFTSFFCSPVLAERASYYADYYYGQRTASGEVLHPNELTAAHARLPFGTRVQVTNLENGSSVTVKINDRCSACDIDLSRAAAVQLDMIRKGVVPVELKIISQ